METVYDWITIGIFAFLVILFLHRSVDVDKPKDHLSQYLLAGVGCAFANWLGNKGYVIVALGVIMATLVFIFYKLQPFGFRSGK